MSKSEIDKRIRATYFPGKPAPFIKLNKHKYMIIKQWIEALIENWILLVKEKVVEQ